MSAVTTLQRPRQIPTGWTVAPCSQCQAVILIRRDEAYTPTCRACRRGEAEREVRKLVGVVNDLIAGEAEFNVLSQFERQEQLNLLGLSAVARAVPDAAPSLELPVYDSGGYRPTDEERDDIESRIEAPEFEAETLTPDVPFVWD